MSKLLGARIHITGIVQGVGFRPFVHGLAARLSLRGWVRNTSAGVDIEVDGPPEALKAFADALRHHAPLLARIDAIEIETHSANGFTTFAIIPSEPIPYAFQPISPDVGICADCLRELFDPRDRRYCYPFINCTNCGPRFTIIKDIPYDRSTTTMASFEMCPDCAAEYVDPLDRCFHAQPVACPRCGPRVWLVWGKGNLQLSIPAPSGEDAIQIARKLLLKGKIVAVKGLGGFHLVCDATNSATVAELRRRKGRVDKPFALMMPDIETVQAHCFVSPAERDLLTSPQRPIVILERRPESTIARGVAPGQNTLGVMLPSTPLHYLITGDSEWQMAAGDGPSAVSRRLPALVMTSGNFSEEPIAMQNEEALTRLAPLAEAFLLHNRDIHVRCDDSVVRVFESQEMPVRRSRGYAPGPVRLPFKAPPVLAVGAELKNTFCVTRGEYAFLSHHIGDMENYETLRSFEGGVAHFESLFRIRPGLIAYDLHPNYLATRYALERAARDGIGAVGVQHHHAHITACMVENRLIGERPVIGVVFDGTGYGTDGAIWGGEFLVADYRGFERAAHLAYVPMPGGDAATRNPYRIALSYLHCAGIEWADDLAPVAAIGTAERAVIAKQIRSGLNAPPTSSMGRLFDAVASIVGIRQSINYEGQAAIELEVLADRTEMREWRMEIRRSGGEGCIVDAAPVIRAVVDGVGAGVPVPIISARFHNAIAVMVRDVCVLIRDERGLNEVALSGGVFQNITLLKRVLDRLRTAGFAVYTHHIVPPNDGGLALGQAVIAFSGL